MRFFNLFKNSKDLVQSHSCNLICLKAIQVQRREAIHQYQLLTKHKVNLFFYDRLKQLYESYFISMSILKSFKKSRPSRNLTAMCIALIFRFWLFYKLRHHHRALVLSWYHGSLSYSFCSSIIKSWYLVLYLSLFVLYLSVLVLAAKGSTRVVSSVQQMDEGILRHQRILTTINTPTVLTASYPGQVSVTDHLTHSNNRVFDIHKSRLETWYQPQ